MKQLKLYYPCKPHVVFQRFGQNALPLYKELGLKGHNGIDLFAPDGWPIRAAHDGVVTFTGEDGSGGLGVVIRTDIPYEFEGGEAYYKTIYWHIKKGSFKVKPGDKVEVGDVIALADNTGASTGSHLHFGLKPLVQGEKEWEWWNARQNNGYAGSIDPEPFFTGIDAGDAKTIIGKIAEGVRLLTISLAEFIASKK